MPVIKCLVLRAEKALGRRVFVSTSLLVFLFLSHPSGIFVCLHLRIDKRKGVRVTEGCSDMKNTRQATWCVAEVMNSSARQKRKATQLEDQFLIRSLTLQGSAKKQYFNQSPPASSLFTT